MAEKPLNAKQKRFVAEYLIDLNATQAYIRAGYSKNGADVSGARLLADARIQREIAAGQAKIAERLELKAEDVVAELRKIGFANMQDYVRLVAGDAVVDLSAATPDQWAAVGELTVEDYMDGRGDDAREVRRTKVKLMDKRAALVDLGRHLGLFREGANLPKTQDLGTLAPADVARELLFGLRVLLDEQARNPAPPASPAKPASVH